MPSRPVLPAASQTSRDTIPSRSHWAWYGVTSRAMNSRTISRNASCSGVKMSRSMPPPRSLVPSRPPGSLLARWLAWALLAGALLARCSLARC